VSVLPDWMTTLSQTSESARMFTADPGDRMPSYAIANYGAIDSGLGDGPVLVSVVGVDRFDNWAALAPQDEKDRRGRWLDAFQAALDREYPGFSAAVSERMFLNARSMHNFMNTPAGAVYGFAPLPFERGIWAGIPRSPKTPIPSVYLASSFTESGGFTGEASLLAGARCGLLSQWSAGLRRDERRSVPQHGVHDDGEATPPERRAPCACLIAWRWRRLSP
jgi:all-trans-retinol 13,14-reductase